MARIPEEELARLKAETDLAALVRASGVELSPVGEDLRGLCCFHEEKTPSLVITPAKGLWHCFGCNLGGSAVDWVMRTQGLSFRHSVEVLRAGLPAFAAPARHVKVSRLSHLPTAVALDADDQRLLNQVIDFYHQTLVSTTDAQDYLAERGLRSSEMVERFKLGYANRTLGYRLPSKNQKAGAELRGRLAALGIYRKSGHEHFAGSLIVPVIEDGQVREVYGRKIAAGQREGTPLHLYLKGPHEGVWNVEALSASKEVILAEAPLDALTWWCSGFKAVTTSYGVYGFTADHLAAFARYGTERIFLAYDGDEEGDKAAEALAPRLAEAGIDVHRVLFPRVKEEKDANGYARKASSPAEALGHLLRSARFMTKGRRPGGAIWAGHPGEVSAAKEGSSPDAQGRNALGSGPAEEVSSPPTAVPTSEGASTPHGPRAGALDLGAAVEPSPSAPASGDGSAAAPPLPEAAAPPLPEAAAPPLPETATPPPPPSAAEPLPFAAPSLVVNGDQADLTIGDRSYRVGNLAKNLSPNAMRVTLRVSRGERVHVDTLELLSDRARQLYVKRAADELAVEPETVKKDLARLLLALEEVQGQRIGRVLAPKPSGVEIPEAEKAEALALLRDPRLLERVVEGFDRIGLVGERTNKLVGYLAAVSRKLASPLAVLLQSNSAAGKSALMDAILELVPPEDVERYTAMTGQSLYYLADTSLRHKVLAIAEVAGADRAGYAIKMLQSEGKISIATTVKDPESGEMKTKKHEVEGPVAIFLTTTEATIDEELQNRAVVLTVNEDREQTRAIHEAQRRAETLEGILATEERQAVVRLHRNAQRLLRPLRVVNPYAVGLTFLDTKLRTRRDHAKYLTLIRAIALLHQYQRPIKQETRNGRVVPYIEVTLSDVEVANHLANDAIGRSLDELAPQARRLLGLLDEMVAKRCAERKIDREDYRFTRREVREHTQWSDPQLWKHLSRLVELEHVLAHRGVRGHSYLYELLYAGEGKDGGRFLVGLIDPKRLATRGEARAACTTVDLTPSEGRSHPPIYPPFTPDLRVLTVGGNGSGATLSPP